MKPHRLSIQEELQQRRPFHSRREELFLALLRTAAVVRRPLAVHLEDIAASRKHRHLLPGDGAIDLPGVVRTMVGEGYGGWKTSDIELAPDHTAVVVMHAWECGTMEQWPGWRRCVEGRQPGRRAWG